MKDRSFIKKEIAAAISLIAFCTLFTSCEGLVGTVGEGPIVTQELTLDDFEGVVLDGSYDVFIEQGPEQRVEAEGHANIIEKLRTSVRSGVWTIDLENGTYRNFRLDIYITVPTLTSVELDGSGNIQIGNFTTDELTIEIDASGDIFFIGDLVVADELMINSDGSGDLDIDNLAVPKLEILMDASGNIDLRGETDEAEVNMDASGDLNAFSFDIKDLTIRSSGSGDAEVTVHDFLKARLFASGDVTYRGSPDIDVTTGGSGDLHNGN